MKQQLRIGSNPVTVRGIAFSRAYLLVQGVGAGAIVDTDFLLNNLRIRIDVNQGDVKDSTSFNAVGPLMRGAIEYEQSTYINNLNLSATGQTCGGVLLAGLTDQSVFSVPLLDGGYILRGEDSISFFIDVLPTFFSANVTNASSVNLVIESGNDIEQIDVNIPVYEPITNDRQSPAYSYDSVSEIFLINAITPYVFSNDPFTSIDVRSQYVNDSFDSNTMADKRLEDFVTDTLIGCSLIYAVEPNTLFDVQVSLTITTANVTIGSQFLYIRKTLLTPQMTARSIAHESKKMFRNLKHRGINQRGLENVKQAIKNRYSK